MLKNSHYFDYAAATPLDQSVLQAMSPYFSTLFYNPSAVYLLAQKVRKDIESARQMVALELGCQPREVVFTAGGTEANNMAVHGIMRRFSGAKLLISSIEHDSVRLPAAQYNAKHLPVSADGIIDINNIESYVDDTTVLVSIMLVNNEVGTIQPIKKASLIIKRICDERRKKGNKTPLYLHTDACQAPNYLQVLVNSLGVDLLTLNGGKIYGPKQSGVLFVRNGIELDSLLQGGGQEKGSRSGTENVPAIIGFSTALEIAANKRDVEQRRVKELQKNFIDALQKNFPSVVVNGTIENRIANNIHISFPGIDNETLMMRLDENDVIVATGSACSASSEEPSHVLEAMGLQGDLITGSLRISLGRDTTQKSLDALLTALRDAMLY
jgi:cysteine desulfurase